MDSNAVVMQQFEDLAVKKLHAFIICVHLLVKNCKLCNSVLLTNVILLNYILKTKGNSVRERVKNTLSRTQLHLVFKILKKKNFTLIKSIKFNNLIFLQKMHTYFKNK